MNAHAELSVYAQHRSYARGCRCRPCTKGHAAYMRDWRRSQGPTSGDGQASLLDQDRDNGSRRSTPVAGSARGNVDELRTPTSPRVGKHHRQARKTELGAAISGVPRFATARGRYLLALVEAGAEGLTDHEAADRTGMPVSSVCARRNELAGWVGSMGEHRVGPYGTANEVHFATKRAHSWAAKIERQSA